MAHLSSTVPTRNHGCRYRRNGQRGLDSEIRTGRLDGDPQQRDRVSRSPRPCADAARAADARDGRVVEQGQIRTDGARYASTRRTNRRPQGTRQRQHAAAQEVHRRASDGGRSEQPFGSGLAAYSDRVIRRGRQVSVERGHRGRPDLAGP